MTISIRNNECSEKVRILFVGDFGSKTDEGMRKLSLMLSNGLGNDFEIKKVTTKEFGLFKELKRIKEFKPAIIHYLTGPTIKSIVSTWIYKKFFLHQTITIHSGIRPYFGPLSRKLIKIFYPNYFLSQDPKWEKLFANAGSICLRVPNGIDCTKFKPVNWQEKKRLREKYGFPNNKKIILHVGHIRENRNLSILKALPKEQDCYVVIVGSKRFSKEKKLLEELTKSGCHVITDYIEKIEEIYQASDVYVFPVKALSENEYPKSYNQVGVIDFPLSVLEAMACNLPIITTPFNAIKHFIGSMEKGIIYFDGTGKGLQKALNFIPVKVYNREIALQFDIENVRKQLKQLYLQLGSVEYENHLLYWH